MSRSADGSNLRSIAGLVGRLSCRRRPGRRGLSVVFVKAAVLVLPAGPAMTRFVPTGSCGGLGIHGIQCTVPIFATPLFRSGTLSGSLVRPFHTRAHLFVSAGSRTCGAGFAQLSRVILLVDDNEALRQGLATLLRDRGCDVLEASGVEQARRLALACSNLQLLITDVALSPTDSGAHLAASIRQRNPHISALLMSAHEDDVLLQYGVRFDETMWVLRKPFTAQEFVARVSLLLSGALKTDVPAAS